MPRNGILLKESVNLHFSVPIVIAVQSLQLCLILFNPKDCSLPGSSVCGIFQARILEWVAGPPSEDLPNPGIEPVSPALQADSLPSEPLACEMSAIVR